jgi:hypothetical protein
VLDQCLADRSVVQKAARGARRGAAAAQRDHGREHRERTRATRRRGGHRPVISRTHGRATLSRTERLTPHRILSLRVLPVLAGDLPHLSSPGRRPPFLRTFAALGALALLVATSLALVPLLIAYDWCSVGSDADAAAAVVCGPPPTQYYLELASARPLSASLLLAGAIVALAMLALAGRWRVRPRSD